MAASRPRSLICLCFTTKRNRHALGEALLGLAAMNGYAHSTVGRGQECPAGAEGCTTDGRRSTTAHFDRADAARAGLLPLLRALDARVARLTHVPLDAEPQYGEDWQVGKRIL